MTEKEFYTTLSKAQSIPGPVAFTIALLIGRKFKGLLGGFISGVAVVLPPFVSILLLFYILDVFKNNPHLVKFLKGIYGALIGLVGGVLYKMVKNQKWNIYKIVLLIFAFFSIILRHTLLFYIFGSVIIINYLISKE
jgi:chromate transporter